MLASSSDSQNKSNYQMGNSVSDYDKAPFAKLSGDAPLNVFGIQYCRDHPMVLLMREKIISFSGDDYTVLTDKGTVLFKVDGKVFSLHNRKKFVDNEGNMVGEVLHKKISPHCRMYILDKEGKVRVVVRKARFLQFSSCAEAWILQKPVDPSNIDKSETSSRPPDLRMGGDWRAKNFLFMNSADHVMCRVERTAMNLRNLIWGKDTYALEVPPYIDLALISLLGVCLDDMFREEEPVINVPVPAPAPIASVVHNVT
jgi:uncharacterized protein YxjI